VTASTSEDLSLPPPGFPHRRSSGEEAALYVRRLIFEGHLRPGDRVPQDEIARRLGISRIPVREALIALEREGWVTLELNRGAFVAMLDENAVRDHYQLFGLVYGFAAKRALVRSAVELVPALWEVVRELASAEDPADVGRLTLTFHSLVVDAACSPRIKVVLRAMSSLLPGNFFELVPGATEIEKKGLAMITTALTRGDGDRAASEYARMMRRQGDLVAKLLRERGLYGPLGLP
jgi:DNA-binding GntR family transcriptional regulator